jgi:hypothetical protein
MRFVRQLGLLVYSVTLGLAPSATLADNPNSFLRLEEPSTVAFESTAELVLLPVRMAGVKEMGVKLVRVEKGSAAVVHTMLIHPSAKGHRDNPSEGNLALLLAKRQEGKVVEASIGKSSMGGGSTRSTRFGAGSVAVPASAMSVTFYTPTGNWPVGRTAVAYGKLYGSKGTEEETVDITGKSVEDVEAISKRHPHLTYILVILSWSPSEGK